MVHVKRGREYFTRDSSGFLGVFPSGIFGIIAWPNCHVFRNVRSFDECCDNCFCMMMIYIRKYSSERHMAGFNGGFLCMNVCSCIFVCIIIWECRQN